MKVIATEKLPIKMWLGDADEETLKQARNIANFPFAYRWVALMPDAHKGYGMPIGGVLATRAVIIPNAVGVDIGCGMCAVRTRLQHIEPEQIKAVMGKVRETIPLGFAHQAEAQEWEGFGRAPDIEVIQRQLDSARKQIGTLGGGNHFIEIQHGDDSFIWLMIHSGSRNLGYKTAEHYHKAALRLCERWASDIPDPELSFLPIETNEGREYYQAMGFCLAFAQANRTLMMDRLVAAMREVTGAEEIDRIDVHHNYASFEAHYGTDVLVHRKGAIFAGERTTGIIPGSMGSLSYITSGKGNPESFLSSSHGAGRRMGRGQAHRTLNLEEEQAKMAGVIHGLRTAKELDEAPGAYKDIAQVMASQEDLTEIFISLRPLGSIKG